MSWSAFLWQRVIESITHAIPYGADENWAGLLDDAGVELSNVNYVRQLIDVPTGAAPKWSASIVNAEGVTVQTEDPIPFGEPTVDWGKVEGGALFDASTGGNELMRELLPNPRQVFVGDPGFTIPAGAFKVRMVRRG